MRTLKSFQVVIACFALIAADTNILSADASDIGCSLQADFSAAQSPENVVQTPTSWKGILSGINNNAVTFFDTATNTIVNSIALPSESQAAVITPNGKTIYAAESNQPNIVVIDVSSNSIIANIPTSVGTGAFDIIVSPNGKKIFVSNNLSGYVTIADTQTNTVVTDIFVGTNLGAIAINPNGKTVYVGNFTQGNITAIDTSSHDLIASIETGAIPGMISITPDGKKAYVANAGSDTVSVVDLVSKTVTDTIVFPAGSGPYGSSLIPTGETLYVANMFNDTVSVVDIATNSITETISLDSGLSPFWAASTPDGKTVYVINQNADTVTPIDVATNTAGASFGPIDGKIQDIVMSPDQAPVATFVIQGQPLGVPTVFDASASASPIGTIASYAWDFGDGAQLTTSNPIVNHVYSSPGLYDVGLTVTNSAGTSTAKVFSSRFMSNNGGGAAAKSHAIYFPWEPRNVKGHQEYRRHCHETDIVNVITWHHPSQGKKPASYNIYRDAALTDLIGSVSAEEELQFEDHHLIGKKPYSYYIVSVSKSEGGSLAVAITVKPFIPKKKR